MLTSIDITKIAGMSSQKCLDLPRLYRLARNDGLKPKSWLTALQYV